jgi:hypothetical protein
MFSYQASLQLECLYNLCFGCLKPLFLFFLVFFLEISSLGSRQLSIFNPWARCVITSLLDKNLRNYILENNYHFRSVCMLFLVERKIEIM